MNRSSNTLSDLFGNSELVKYPLLNCIKNQIIIIDNTEEYIIVIYIFIIILIID